MFLFYLTVLAMAPFSLAADYDGPHIGEECNKVIEAFKEAMEGYEEPQCLIDYNQGMSEKCGEWDCDLEKLDCIGEFIERIISYMTENADNEVYKDCSVGVVKDFWGRMKPLFGTKEDMNLKSCFGAVFKGYQFLWKIW